MNIKSKILSEFSKLNCIIDEKILEEYVDFCILNSQQTKNESSTHHILPRAKTLPFVKFENLVVNDWNSAELSYYNHYIAHWLLARAVDHIAITSSFIAMHNKDVPIGRIRVEDLVSEKEYTSIYKRRNQQISEHRMEVIATEHGEMSRAKFYLRNKTLSESTITDMRKGMSGAANIVHLDGVVDKIRATKSTKMIDGKNMDTISAERAAATMNKPIILQDGSISTTYKENGKKLSMFLNSKILVDGRITTPSIEKGLKRSKKDLFEGIWYRLLSVTNPEIDYMLPMNHIREISAGLTTKTKFEFLGKSVFGRNKFMKDGKSKLIGLYVEVVQPDHEYRSQYLENNLKQQIFEAILG